MTKLFKQVMPSYGMDIKQAVVNTADIPVQVYILAASNIAVECQAGNVDERYAVNVLLTAIDRMLDITCKMFRLNKARVIELLGRNE